MTTEHEGSTQPLHGSAHLPFALATGCHGPTQVWTVSPVWMLSPRVSTVPGVSTVLGVSTVPGVTLFLGVDTLPGVDAVPGYGLCLQYRCCPRMWTLSPGVDAVLVCCSLGTCRGPGISTH